MAELGGVLAFGVCLLAMLWYREALSGFSRTLARYDKTQAMQLQRGARQHLVAAIRDQWTKPSADPDSEHWRGLMHRRMRLMLVGAVLFVVLPALFGLIEVDGRFLSRRPFGVLWLGGIAALLLYWSWALARSLIAYGRGDRLDARRVWTSVAAITVVGVVMIGILLTT